MTPRLGGEVSEPDALLRRGFGREELKLLGLDIKMFYAGPKEAVMHAIYRQNMGYTNIIIGRKHADVPYSDGTNIWGDFDTHQIFDKLNGELLIQPVKVGFAGVYLSQSIR